MLDGAVYVDDVGFCVEMGDRTVVAVVAAFRGDEAVL